MSVNRKRYIPGGWIPPCENCPGRKFHRSICNVLVPPKKVNRTEGKWQELPRKDGRPQETCLEFRKYWREQNTKMLRTAKEWW